ncbi:hypothetical protein HHK36_024562 [Tetracentron sinense]|uniref:ATP-dependent Clp protease proteolytic subunit n=1 Tax=Tetracentron sinense TaxID=13715 RepID=A0A834YN77_TETSI|nr:hypothetical protein HHK36_024562 [Tetracentron sinense]
MERGLTFTASPSRPSCFTNGVFTQFHLNPCSPSTLRRKPIPVKAMKSPRQSLSTNWNISNSAPTWMPRFEELDTTNMLLRQRIIFLGSQVDDVTADLIISQLLFLDAEDEKKDIKLFINSPGGSVTAGRLLSKVLTLFCSVKESGNLLFVVPCLRHSIHIEMIENDDVFFEESARQMNCVRDILPLSNLGLSHSISKRIWDPVVEKMEMRLA